MELPSRKIVIFSSLTISKEMIASHGKPNPIKQPTEWSKIDVLLAQTK